MKLKNKKTGEVIDVKDALTDSDNFPNHYTISGDWEDYEEPKGKALYWMILTLENFIENEPDDKWVDLEDCKQMLEKLKAWQRLKDKGLEVTEWSHGLYLDKTIVGRFRYEFPIDNKEDIEKDLDLLFGGEE